MLLGHFIVGLGLVLYLFLRLWVHRKLKAGEVLKTTRIWLAIIGYFFIALCIGMILGDIFIQLTAFVNFKARVLRYDVYGWM